jgi:hypothetical protein
MRIQTPAGIPPVRSELRHTLAAPRSLKLYHVRRGDTDGFQPIHSLVAKHCVMNVLLVSALKQSKAQMG